MIKAAGRPPERKAMKKPEKKNRNHEKKKAKKSAGWRVLKAVDDDTISQLQEGILPGFIMDLAGAADGGCFDICPACILRIDVSACLPAEDGGGETDAENSAASEKEKAPKDGNGTGKGAGPSGTDPCKGGSCCMETSSLDRMVEDILAGGWKDGCLYGTPGSGKSFPARHAECPSGGAPDPAKTAGTSHAGSPEADLQEMYRDLEFFKGMMLSACKIAEAMDPSGEKGGYVASLLRSYVNMAGAALKKWEKYSRKDA